MQAFGDTCRRIDTSIRHPGIVYLPLRDGYWERACTKV